jgi:hypothetical protein
MIFVVITAKYPKNEKQVPYRLNASYNDCSRDFLRYFQEIWLSDVCYYKSKRPQ